MAAIDYDPAIKFWNGPLNGRSLLTFLQRLLPFVMLAVVGLALQVPPAGDVPLVPGGDRQAFDLAVAESLSESNTLALPGGASATPGSHMLWQVLLGVMGWLVSDLLRAALILNFVLAALVVWQVIRLSERVLLHPVFVMAAGAVTAVSLPVQSGMASAGPNLLAMALILGAIRLHMSGIVGTRPVLNLASALLVGLAMLVHPEFILVWIAFMLHAWVAGFSQESKFFTSNVILQGLAGLALCLVLLWPVVHMSAGRMQTMWVVQHELETLTNQSGIGISQVMGDMLSGGGLLLSAAWALAALGIVALARQFGVRRQSRALAVSGFLLVVVPVVYGLLAKATGLMASHCLSHSLFPLVLVTGLFGAFWVGSLISRKMAVTLTIVAATVLSILSISQVFNHSQEQVTARKASVENHSFWSSWIDSNTRGNGRLNVATDRPGWLAYQGGANVTVDLNGWASPSVSECRNGDHDLDAQQLISWLTALEEPQRPSVLVLWDLENHGLAADLGRVNGKLLKDISPTGRETPQIHEIRWTAVRGKN